MSQGRKRQVTEAGILPWRSQQDDSTPYILLSYGILIGGMIAIAVTANVVITNYSSLPLSDGWIQIFVAAEKSKAFPLEWLWRQHNEHRLVIPKLFLLVDLHFFQARQVFLLVCVFAVQLLNLLLLAWSMRNLGGWRGSLLRSGVGLAAFCLFCPTQWENFTWGFQTCFVLPPMFASLSFIGLLLYQRELKGPEQHRARKFLLLSVIAALGATYSLASGNLLWPLLVAAALLLRLPRSAVLSYGITGTFSTWLYLHHYLRPPQNTDPVISIKHPILLLEYFAAYFGSSWVRQSITAAVILGLVGVLLASVILWKRRRVTELCDLFSLQLCLTLLFCLGTGFLTALGRSGAGIAQSFSSRYQTVALLFWCCLGLLLLSSKSGGLRFAALGLQLLMLLVFVRGEILARFPLRDARENAFQLRAAAAALVTGANDREQLAHAFPNPDYVLSVVPFMKAQHLSVFSEGISTMVGRPVHAQLARSSAAECVGTIQSVAALSASEEPELRIAGWAWDRKRRTLASNIVVAADGKVVGVGAIGDWRPVRAANRFLTTSFVGFTAYAKNFSPNSTLKLYAMAGDNPAEACYLTTPITPAPEVHSPEVHSEVK